MGDVPTVQSQDGAVRKSLRNVESGSGGSSQTLQEPAKSTSTNSTIRLSGAEYPAGPHHQYATRPSREQMTIPLNMADMNPALPPYSISGIHYGQPNVQHHYVQTPQSPGMMYPMPHMPYMSPSPGQAMYNVPYSPGYQGPYVQQHPQGYATFHPPHQTGNTFPAQPGMYNPPYYPQHPYNPGLETNRTGSRSQHSTQSPQMPSQKEAGKRVTAENYDVSQTIVDGSSPMKSSSRGVSEHNLDEREPVQSPLTVAPSAPRGPPRKPKQSGHALWVGNLPPATSVIDLKDHFAQDATADIESVFLIAKSNCAFVNYKSEAACAAAVTRFHDSRFHGVKLVCRLRKGVTVPGSSQSQRLSLPTTVDSSSNSTDTPGNDNGLLSAQHADGTTTPSQKPLRVPERFFVVKSLTVEDLEGSRQSGVWATQTHNEKALNEAYESAENVYLIFSANKSGEYFGYARMVSPIVDDGSIVIEAPPRLGNLPAEADNIEVTPTEATATAPKGRIIDDSVRGTIFWEADTSEDEEEEEEDKSDGEENKPGNNDNNKNDGDEEPGVDGDAAPSEKDVYGTDETSATGTQSLGRPFRIQWMSTDRVPFYRTRGLRNPWNANREVKIARDGTEIEPSVGRRLIQLFHTHQPGPVTPSSGQAGSGFRGTYCWTFAGSPADGSGEITDIEIDTKCGPRWR